MEGPEERQAGVDQGVVVVVRGDDLVGGRRQDWRGGGRRRGLSGGGPSSGKEVQRGEGSRNITREAAPLWPLCRVSEASVDLQPL